MTTIDVDLSRALDPSGSRSIDGTVLARTRWAVPAWGQGEASSVATTETAEWRLEGGSGQLQADPTPLTNALVIEFTGPGLERPLSVCVAVPDEVEPVALTSLVQLDPSTLEPGAEPEAAWWAAADGAIAAASEASTAATAAEGAAAAAQQAAGAAQAAVGTVEGLAAEAQSSAQVAAGASEAAALSAGQAASTAATAQTTAQNALDVAASKVSLTDLETAVEDAVEAHTPGMELGYVERTSNFTTTATAAGAGAIIPAFSVTVIGQGRPVDFECYLPQVFHSVANTAVLCYLTITTGGVAANVPYTTVSSVRTDAGEAVLLRRRRTLAAGVSYTVTVNVYGLAAGTTTVAGATSTYPFLSAVSR